METELRIYVGNAANAGNIFSPLLDAQPMRVRRQRQPGRLGYGRQTTRRISGFEKLPAAEAHQ